MHNCKNKMKMNIHKYLWKQRGNPYGFFLQVTRIERDNRKCGFGGRFYQDLLPLHVKHAAMCLLEVTHLERPYSTFVFRAYRLLLWFYPTLQRNCEASSVVVTLWRTCCFGSGLASLTLGLLESWESRCITTSCSSLIEWKYGDGEYCKTLPSSYK